MRRDREEELQRLKQALLEEEQQEPETEDTFDEFLEEDGEDPVVYRNHANQYGADLRNAATGYKAYNADRTDTDLESYSENVRSGRKRTPLWLPLLFVALTVLLLVLGFILLGGRL